MAVPLPQHPDRPYTSGSLGYFHLRLVGPAPTLLLLRTDRLYSLSHSRRRGYRLRLLASPHRRRARDLLLSTYGCDLRLRHRSGTGSPSVNGRPLRAGTPTELAVGDEVSVLRCGTRYGFIVERFVSCRGVEVGAASTAGSCAEGLVFRAESLRKRLRAISESEDPLSLLRDCSGIGSLDVDVGPKKWRQDGAGELCLDNPVTPASEEKVLQGDCNFDQDKLENHLDVANDGDGELPFHGSKGCRDDNAEQPGCGSGNEEQYHSEACYSDGSTFFLNRLVGTGSDTRAEPQSGVTLPQLLHPVDSLVRVFIATFTSDISWFLNYCKIPQHLPVTIACHNKDRCWSASSENRTAAPFESHPKLLLVFPRFPEEIAFGQDRKKQGVACHHPKLIVLQREDSMRVIVTSANLVPRQWHLITNTVWWQDFPRRTSLDYAALFSAAEKQKSDFAAQLVSFIASMVNEVPSQAYLINEIAKYDFEGAGGYLIASVPGIHAQSPPYLESNYFLSAKHNVHAKSAHRMFIGSVQTSVVGLSHRFHMPLDAGKQLRALSAFFGKCRENMHGTTEVILKRNTNIPADANAVSVLVADLDQFTEEDSVQLGFLPREVAKWVAPLSDSGFFNFSGFIYPREALEAAYGVTNTKVQLLLYISKGPEFSQISGLISNEHFPPLCSLIASLQRCLGLWRLEEVLSNIKWPETLETDFIYSASSIGTSINPQFIASFASAAGKRPHQDFDSQESDPEWGCWTTNHELKKPSISLLFPTIDRVKKGACGIQLCRNLLSLPEKTWQRLRSTGIFHDAIPQPYARIGHPMHVKVAQRRFKSCFGEHSFGWTYCGSHNFSPAAWGQPLSPPSKANPSKARSSPSGPRLHICNYELGIVLIAPPPGMSKHASESRHRIEGIVLPFVIPPPRYKGSDRPATRLAMREAVAEACVVQGNDVEDLSEDTDEDVPDEDDEQVVELSDCSQQEKEEEKIYAETLWGQVDSSQSQEKD